MKPYSSPFQLSVFSGQFPSAPPNSFRSPIDTWTPFHKQLDSSFSDHLFHKVDTLHQEWRDCEGERFLIYLPQQLPFQFRFDLTEYIWPAPKSKQACRRFPVGAIPGSHHGFHSFKSKTQGLQWKLFHGTDRTLLFKCKPLLLYMEDLYQQFAPEIWSKCRSNIPQGFGLFGTIWTTVVINVSDCVWHYDPRDQGFTILLYFGAFQQGHLRLAPPIQLDVPVQPNDIVFLLSSKIYHKVMPFTGRRINLTMYSTKVQKKEHTFSPLEDQFREK